MKKLTVELIRELLSYDPITGLFHWNKRSIKFFPDKAHWKSWNTRFAGKVAGGIATNGYCYINVEPTSYLAHRLAWLYVYGEWSKKGLDHINRVRSDNRISNLREANHAENGQNLKRGEFTGVSWHKRTEKWHARIMVNYKNIHIGLYDSREDAHAAYLAVKDKVHRFSSIVWE